MLNALRRRGPARDDEAPLVTRVYPIADLLRGFEGKDDDPAPLLDLVMQIGPPGSWGNGGRGTVAFLPATKSLVVNQAPAVQEQIGRALQAIRAFDDWMTPDAPAK